MGGYFYSSKAFQVRAWTELPSCKLRLILLQSCSKGHVRSWCTPVSGKVGRRKGCFNSVCSPSENRSPAFWPGCCSSRLRRCGVHRQPYSQNAEPRRSKWQPLTGMPVSRAFCYASFLWSPLPATEKEIKEKLSSASYLCTPVSFLSFFLFISDNCRGSKTQRELLCTNPSLLRPQPRALQGGSCTIAWSSRPLKNVRGDKS